VKKLVASIVAAAVSGVVIASSVCLSAEAADPVATDPTPPTVKVTKVVKRHSSKAQVKLTMKCPRHSTYSLSLELIQDKDPLVGVFDSYYTGTKALEGTCTGHKQRIKLTAKADPSGSFAPADARLKRGTVEVVLGGTLDDEFVLRSINAKVR